MIKRAILKLLPGLYGLLVYFTIRLLEDTGSGFHFWRRPAFTNGLELIMSFSAGFIFVGLMRRYSNYVDRKQIGKKIDTYSITRELVNVFLLNAMVANLLLTPFTALTDDGLSINDFVVLNIVPLLYTLIYYGRLRSTAYLKAFVSNQLVVEQLTNDKLETELKLLKAQYHPHFLFNALNTIYFRVDDDVPGAKRNIEQLSKLLRYQLYDQEQLVPIKKEIDYLRNYIELQKTRVSTRLNLSLNFDAGLQEQKIHPLLFLPLAENAFKYIGGKYDLHISIQNNGNGIVFQVINSVPDHPAAQPKGEGGMGLENLRRRLQLLYPDKHLLLINSTGSYFKVELEIYY